MTGNLLALRISTNKFTIYIYIYIYIYICVCVNVFYLLMPERGCLSPSRDNRLFTSFHFISHGMFHYILVILHAYCYLMTTLFATSNSLSFFLIILITVYASSNSMLFRNFMKACVYVCMFVCVVYS